MGKSSISHCQLSARAQIQAVLCNIVKKIKQGASEPTQRALLVKTAEHRYSSADRQINPARTAFTEATRDCPSHDLAAAQKQLVNTLRKQWKTPGSTVQ